MNFTQEEIDRITSETGARITSATIDPDQYKNVYKPEFRKQVVDEVIKSTLAILAGDYMESVDPDKWMPMGFWKFDDFQRLGKVRYKLKWWTYLTLCWFGKQMSNLESWTKWQIHYFRKKYDKKYLLRKTMRF